MDFDEFEKCGGKSQSTGCCTKPEKKPVTPVIENQLAYGYGFGGMGILPDYDEDDGYFRHVAAESARRDHFGFRADQKVIGPVTMNSGTSKEK